MHRWRAYITIVLLGSLLFIPFLGASHLFDWDEINFAEASREMVLTGNYTQTQVDFQQFWEKPPFFFWLQAAAMHVFGINAFAARFPNAVCGILTLLILFAIGKRVANEKLAGWWVICYAGSILPQFYFKSGIIDPWFNLFIFIGIYAFIRFIQDNQSWKWLCISAFAAGLSALTKGPVGPGLVGITIFIYYVLNRFRKFPSVLQLLTFIVFVLLPLMPWILIEVSRNGTWFITEFFTYQTRLATTEDASHGGFPGYHFVVLFFFCFPASAFAIRNMVRPENTDTTETQFRQWMLILFWVVLIVFTIVQTKIAHYSSMAYFPLTFLAASRLSKIEYSWSRLEKTIIIITGAVFSLILIGVPWLLMNTDVWGANVKDVFSAEAIHADGDWSFWNYGVGAAMLIGLMVSLWYAYKNRAQQALLFLFFSSTLVINVATISLTPRIERYSQGAMVDFLMDKSDEDCYTDIAGFKSYAHLFYGERKYDDVHNPVFTAWLKNQKPDTENITAIEYRQLYSRWLVEGDIDKPVYLITNARKKHYLDMHNDLEMIGNENGFYFYLRKP